MSRQVRIVVPLVLVAFVAWLTFGCSTDEVATTSTTPASEFNAIEQSGRVPEILRDHLGGNPELRRLSLGSNGFSAQVRDPEKRDNLDDYSFYSGTWTTRPVSVSVSEIEEYESVTFTLADIDWEAIPGLVRQALDGLDLEGEEIGGVGFDRLSGEAPRVYISVNGLRGSGRLIANADGTNVDIQRN